MNRVGHNPDTQEVVHTQAGSFLSVTSIVHLPSRFMDSGLSDGVFGVGVRRMRTKGKKLD